MVLASAVILFCGASAAQTLKPVEVVTVEKVELGAGGLIRITGSQGELNIEGWDRPEVEVTVARYTESKGTDKTALEAIRVATQKAEGNEVTISTGKIRRHTGINVDYRIRAPRDARLSIQHGTGDVVITGIAGGIDVHAKNAEIVVMLPGPGKYDVHAKAKLGTVYSELGGEQKRLFPFGTEVGEPRSAPPVNLVTDNGGVTLLKP